MRKKIIMYKAIHLLVMTAELAWSARIVLIVEVLLLVPPAMYCFVCLLLPGFDRPTGRIAEVSQILPDLLETACRFPKIIMLHSATDHVLFC